MYHNITYLRLTKHLKKKKRKTSNRHIFLILLSTTLPSTQRCHRRNRHFLAISFFPTVTRACRRVRDRLLRLTVLFVTLIDPSSVTSTDIPFSNRNDIVPCRVDLTTSSYVLYFNFYTKERNKSDQIEEKKNKNNTGNKWWFTLTWVVVITRRRVRAHTEFGR